jgi:hypothetical protein
MTTNENPLENLEFFETFSADDPIESIEFDPNENIKPDILNGEEFDPTAEPEEEEDLDDLPDLTVRKPAEKQPTEPEPEESEEEDEVNLEDDEDEDVENYFEVFGKGLAKVGLLDVEDGEEVEWNEETFLQKMEESIQSRAWGQLEELATETYGEAGVKLIEDIFINKVPVEDYLKMFSNEQLVENVDLDNADNQEQVLRIYLSKTGMDADEVEDQVQYAINNDRLEAYAKKYHGKLLERMEQEREALAQESQARVQEIQRKEQERNQLYAQILEESIKAGEIEGYPINNNSAADLFDFVLHKPHVLPNGQRISEFEYKLASMRQNDPAKFLAVARLVQNDLDLTPVKKKGVTEETSTIFNQLKTKTKKSTKSSKSDQDLFSKYFK